MRRPIHAPARLSYLVQQKLRMFVWCIRCHHHAAVEVSLLIEKLGANFPIPRVAQHMKCSQCGNREVTVNPDWNDEVVPGRPESMRYPPLMT
jgi:hypothetical protein